MSKSKKKTLSVWVPSVAPKPVAQPMKVFVAEPGVEQWQCKYGCSGSVVNGMRNHSWNCDYWQREGITETPF